MRLRFKITSVLRILALPLFALPFLFINCSRSINTEEKDSGVSSLSDKLVPLSTASYSIDSKAYTVQNYKLATSAASVYFQFISACSTKCPVVVVSMPYTGTDWSGDSVDLTWASKDPNGTGVLVPDVNGPNYQPNSNDVIAYYHSSVGDAVGSGGVFLNSGISTMVVYSRFYLGRTVDQYVSDFALVLNHLSDFPTIDTSKVALLGNSLGGFIALHASRKSAIKPIAIVGTTPLLDLPNEYTAMSTASQRITNNPALLTSAQNFFNSYLRRFESVARDQFTSDKIASENPSSNILIIHDTWDTIVPISQWQHFNSVRTIDSFIFQHAAAINYNTFSTDHSQASEGYTGNSAIPIYMSYILNRLKAPSDSKIIYYFYNDFASALVQAKAAKDRGQNISWIKNLFTDLCTSNLTMKDVSNTLGTTTGANFVGGVLVNIWNLPTTAAQGCSYLVSNPHIFD